MPRLPAAVAIAIALVHVGPAIAAPALEPLTIVVPDRDNLQDLPFQVARGAGYFRDEGFAVTLDVPDAPSDVTRLLHADAEQVAVLPPPIYLSLIAERFPLRIVANLLRNDAIDLVVRRALVTAKKLPVGAGVAERLRALAGVRIGVAPGPVSRLRALYRSQGLDADALVTLVPLMGPEQNDAFAAGKVDALYAHTPFLERALVEQDAVLYVNQSAGEVPALAGRLIHALCVTAPLVAHRPDVVKRLVHAIARAEALVHRDPAAARAAVGRALPSRAPALIARAVELYAPAVPPTPAVSAAGVRDAIAFFPATKRAPDFRGIDFSAYVDGRFVPSN